VSHPVTPLDPLWSLTRGESVNASQNGSLSRSCHPGPQRKGALGTPASRLRQSDAPVLGKGTIVESSPCFEGGIEHATDIPLYKHYKLIISSHKQFNQGMFLSSPKTLIGHNFDFEFFDFFWIKRMASGALKGPSIWRPMGRQSCARV
jgi:hypothetical protein